MYRQRSIINNDLENSVSSQSGSGHMQSVARTCLHHCFSIQNLKKKLPIIVWLPKYSWRSLQSDMVAGITVGLTVIPQGLAYAAIAGLPPQYGLYSAFMGCFIYCFLGTSKDITLGPTAIMSLMTSIFATSPVQEDPTYAIILTLMVGLVQLVMGILNLGIIVSFISYPVINAFTSTAAIFIAIGQIKGILGLHNIPRDIIFCIYETFARIGETNVWDCALGIVCMFLIYFMKKLRCINWRDGNIGITKSQKVGRKILWLVGTATNAVIVISAAAMVAVFDSQNIYSPITTCDRIKEGFPPFKPPTFSLNASGTFVGGAEILKDIGVGLGVVPILGLVELIAIGHAFARKNKYRIDATQELVATGVANIVSSFVSSYPITGSFSRTAINSQSGACTPAAGIFTGTLVLLALGVLSPLFDYVPIATLSAMIIMAVLPMVDVRIVRDLWRMQKLDLIPWTTTVIMSFVIGIEYGIMCGIGVSLLLLLHPTARPRVHTNGRHIITLTLDNGIQYPAADYITDKIMEYSSKDDVCIILDCSHIYSIDYTSMQAFVNIHNDLMKQEIPLILMRVRPHIMDQLLKTGVMFKVAGTLEEAHWICEDTLSNPGETRPIIEHR